MTRKCILCKETNYKNSFSFFSAPKDPETRKKWTEAIGIDNYVVTDDTYVCSKHFTAEDIITHWISGIPPHVVTIKYKKCRLRPGAVPSTSCESMNNLSNNQEDEYDVFEVNRGSGTVIARRPFLGANVSAEKQRFSIPREDETSEDVGIEIAVDEIPMENEEILVYKQGEISEQYAIPDDVCNNADDDDDDDDDESFEETNNSVLLDNPEEEPEDQTELKVIYLEEVEKFVSNEEESEMMYVEGMSCEQIETIEEELEEAAAQKARIGEFTPMETQKVSTAEETSTEMWDSVSNENAGKIDDRVYQNSGKTSNDYYSEDEGQPTPDPLDIRNDTEAKTIVKPMLFEDLLDVHTEVQLPGGWSSMVTSKGHGTTVVYVYMSMTENGSPYVEKQVFFKSDMKLRCTAANKELNPQMHNLVRDERNWRVYTLLDVEELVEEFHQRTICEGWSSEKTHSEDIDASIAYRDVTAKWRHIECPIIVNNGANRCSKCISLDSSLTRLKVRRYNAESHDFATAMMKKEKTIRALQRLLRKLSKRNKRYETMKDSIGGKYESLVTQPERTFDDTVESLNMPKIQKIMVKECLRASSTENGKTKYSETWVFLCLLLYIESPRMYRYMLVNKYMILPSMRIIRRYLHQIKTDPQFYSLFQQTVEPFQPNEREDEKEPT